MTGENEKRNWGSKRHYGESLQEEPTMWAGEGWQLRGEEGEAKEGEKEEE